ncbi:MAG: sigma-54-dependent Fis family transcriptional regulator [Acidobacteria bacterium]|nr:sigma-54-dependent Fis family transcriptional regulator [Acidobacteriota bacterium]
MRLKTDVQLIGTSAVIRDLREELARVARCDAKVLITGESGTGKEVVARIIGAHSLRASAPFVPVNCAGLPENLLESELFGHVKGSFTGAYRDKPGKLEMARNGTIFLDEIGEMTPRMQGLLLRFLETGEIQKVGAEQVTMASNVRVIAATNRNLRDLITQGQFREDLFFRLNVIHIVVPPLRERREDIPLLVEFFLHSVLGHGDNGHGEQRVPPSGVTVRGFSTAAMRVLADASWPGNVRQLENVVERLLVTARHEVIDVDELPTEVRMPAVRRPVRERRRTVADDLFQKLVDERESFWTAVYPLYMNREITRSNVRDLVHKGLAEARGNYKIVARLFNLEPREYKRFLNFLRKHDCQLPFKEYRQ